MTAITATRVDGLQDGLQPFEARKHLRQVAELIAQVFGNEMDASGRSAADEMQTIGRWSPVLGGILSTSLFSDLVTGFVWVDNGRVVGNVTLQRQEESGTRWRISNVAVSDAYRRQGIARIMMLATLREIARRAGSWAVLQVRVDNPPARRLYERLGFTNVCQDGLWYAPVVTTLPALPDPNPLRPLAPRDWRARLDLAQASRSALAHWAEPVNIASYRPGLARSLRELLGEVTGLQRVSRWGLWQEQGVVLFGDIQVTANGPTGGDHLLLAVRHEAPEGTAQDLVAQGLHALRAIQHATPSQVSAEYHGELLEPQRTLEAAGFRPRRVLLTMRRLITPGDAELPIPDLD